MRPGPLNLITDIAGFRVGNAADPVLKSGVTVLTSDMPFSASYSVMGGAPGTRETDLLEPDKSVEGVDALVLSGGSAFGLAAAQGVMEALAEAGRGFAVHSVRVPITPAAIIFDLLNGGDKTWSVNPYPALGRIAYEDAGTVFGIGSHGAGTGAQTAMHKGGLGSASLVLADGLTVAALVVANPMGSVATPSGRHFWAAPFEVGHEFGGLGTDPAPGLQPLPASRKAHAMAQQGNTTIAIVATDAQLTKAQCKRLATAAQDGIARAIVPAHSPHDGDLVFAAASGAKPLDLPAVQLSYLGHAASVCLSRAIARAVWEATPAPGDTLPTFRSELPG
ncbi:P1 family peptidase [Mesobacterium sp. TK19101]|uniref:P1 family peptidase n=1 Tax=Mesobacterium hydrothermale TaxID=3111907 RepID=A0ABU6HKI5_9RHOB|nr:P1 family peptidase [Mesobacterium sp. TK19101]MEC3862856.1 P1 family peptidase [Mesobacterium sp. TK19101]